MLRKSKNVTQRREVRKVISPQGFNKIINDFFNSANLLLCVHCVFV